MKRSHSKSNKKGRGRPSTVTIEIEKQELQAADGNIRQFFKSKVRKFSGSSGGYIPISEQYFDHDVFIVVLEKNGNL